jgi:hypothetical protein
MYPNEQSTSASRKTWIGLDTATIAGGTKFKLDASRPVDIDVTFGPDTDPRPVRLVGVPMYRDYGYFLTNLPRSTHTLAEVAMLYRLRWAIECGRRSPARGAARAANHASTAHPRNPFSSFWTCRGRDRPTSPRRAVGPARLRMRWPVSPLA